MAVYESDPEPEDDSRFVAASLGHLVEGNHGRLLDARRTPISVVAVEPVRGSFVVQIEAFEDRGAHWELGVDEVDRFQFSRDARTADPGVVTALAQARERFDRTLRIDADSNALQDTLRAIAAEQRRAEDAIGAVSGSLQRPEAYAHRRRGEPALVAALEQFLAERGLAELDGELARAFVSNPNAGELVKAHAMVLARLGLCPFAGRVLRDPAQLRTPWSGAMRRRHIVARLGFMAALWDAWELTEVTLYRGMAAEGSLEPARSGSFVSATFSREVAEAHFEGGRSTVVAAIWRQRVPVQRVLMTFLETAAHNERFLEAEAVLLGVPEGPAF